MRGNAPQAWMFCRGLVVHFVLFMNKNALIVELKINLW